MEIHLDTADDFPGCNHVHTARKVVDHVCTQVPRQVSFVPVSQPESPVLPATSPGIARQSAVVVNELVSWISLPMRRLTPSRDDYARAAGRLAGFGLNRGGQVHQGGDGTEDA